MIASAFKHQGSPKLSTPECWCAALLCLLIVLLAPLTLRILPDLATENLDYDVWGNLWHRRDFAGKTTTYGYDVLDRLKTKTADATHPSLVYAHAIARVEYDYDANGAREAARTYGAANTLLYTESTPHDERGRLDYKDAPDGRLDYSYYANGQLQDTVSSNPDGVNLGYRYDDANRLAYVDDATHGVPPRTTAYTYNPNGSLETVAYANGVTHAYGYDALNRLRTLNIAQTAGLGASLHTYDYQLTASGHRHQVIEGAKTTTYGYDDLYRLTGETITGAPPGQNGTVGHNLDKVGNRLDRTSSLSAVPSAANQTYNARDQLSTDTYDTNGNTKNSGLLAVRYPLLTTTSVPDVYDFEDRLIVRTRPDGATINLSYDADGVRIQKTILALTGQLVSSTRYLVDTHNLTGYAQAAENAVTLDANAIRFSQSNVRSSLPELTASMRANGWQGAPIDVVRMADGSLTAVDNTRLAAASLSNTPVSAVIRSFDEVFPAARAGGNLQGGTWGEAITNRIGGQKPAWQQLYPNGSPFTGVHPSTPGFTP